MQSEDIDGKVLETWTPEEVQDAMMDDEIVLIDVRTPQEYMFESIPGALLAPLANLGSVSMPVGGDKPVVLYCGSAKRSRKAAEMCLGNKGFAKIAHLEGGFGNWKKAKMNYLGTNMATGAPERMS